MIRLAKTLPIPGTFFRAVVSAEFNSTTVPNGHFSTFGYEGKWRFDSLRMRLGFRSEGTLFSFEWNLFSFRVGFGGFPFGVIGREVSCFILSVTRSSGRTFVREKSVKIIAIYAIAIKERSRVRACLSPLEK